jgi:protein SCO1
MRPRMGSARAAILKTSLFWVAIAAATIVAGARLGRWLDPTIGWQETPAWCRPRRGVSSRGWTPGAGRHLPPFSYIDQGRRLVTPAQLRGSIVIADTIFTSCTGVCPLLSAHMVWLQRQLPEATVRFVSFSVDSEHDDPKALAEYATRWGADPRWSFLVTDRRTLPGVATGFGLGAAGLNNPGSFAHSDRFALVDGAGLLRGIYDVSDPAVLRRLVADARALLKSPTSPRIETDAAGLLTTLGCAGCHGDPRTGPSLVALGGRLVPLADGGHISANAAYLRRAILEPSAEVVAGYGPTMPSYAGRISAAELTSLVTYLMRGT